MISAQAALALEAFLKDEDLSGVNGPDAVSEAFAKARMTRDPTAEWVPGHGAICYEASPASLKPVPLQEGETIRWLEKNENDLKLCESLVHEFATEISVLNSQDAGALAARRLKEGAGKMLVLEKDNDVCAYVASFRSTEKYGVITGVFTAIPWRRQSCARRAVSAMCHNLLQDKELLALFADPNEVGPNALYVSLGFSAVSTMRLWELPTHE